MERSPNYTFEINITSSYLEEDSLPEQNHYVFAYTIQIRNIGDTAAQLISRHWIIRDANGDVEEVKGQGVVGEQPHIEPGDQFEYTSGAVIKTAVGTMQGNYSMVGDDGTQFDTPIPEFTLAAPRTLH